MMNVNEDQAKEMTGDQPKGYTPGPWKLSGHPARVVAKRGYPIADLVWDYSSVMSVRTHEANARLIAAAPELLKELERLYLYVDALRQDGKIDKKCLKVTEGTLNKALKAIAKARGQS